MDKVKRVPIVLEARHLGIFVIEIIDDLFVYLSLLISLY